MNFCIVWLPCALFLIGGSNVMSSHSANRKINIHDLITLLNTAEESSEERIIEKPKKHVVKISAVNNRQKPSTKSEHKRILHPEENNLKEAANSNSDTKPNNEINTHQENNESNTHKQSKTDEKYSESNEKAQTQSSEQENNKKSDDSKEQSQSVKQNNESPPEYRRSEHNNTSVEKIEENNNNQNENTKLENKPEPNKPNNTEHIGNTTHKKSEDNNTKNESVELDRKLYDENQTESIGNEDKPTQNIHERNYAQTGNLGNDGTQKLEAINKRNDSNNVNTSSNEIEPITPNKTSAERKFNRYDYDEQYPSSLERKFGKKIDSEENKSTIDESESETENNERRAMSRNSYEEISSKDAEDINRSYEKKFCKAKEKIKSGGDDAEIEKKDFTKQCDLDNLLQVKNFKLAFNFKR